MHLIQKAAVAGAGITCLTALLVPAAASATGEHAGDTNAPTGLQVYSNDEYVAEFGVQRAIAEGVPLPADADAGVPLAPPDPSIP